MPASTDGTYQYVANLPGQQVRGTMCVVGDTVLDGKQVCTQTVNETYETTEVRRGALRVQRIS